MENYMKGDPYHDKESISELLKQYNNLRNGIGHIFFEEEAFEKIIEYYDEQEDMGRALEAAEMAISRLYSGWSLWIFSADSNCFTAGAHCSSL